MNISDMFVKKIDRNIHISIDIEQDFEGIAKECLEEYVFTQDLVKSFSNIFSRYRNFILGNSDRNCVWISGAKGSGKSHLLKVVSYFMCNSEIDGKKATDYFNWENKTNSSTLLANIMIASNANAEIIKFNIDKKYGLDIKENKIKICQVLAKEFFEMQKNSKTEISTAEKQGSESPEQLEDKPIFETNEDIDTYIFNDGFDEGRLARDIDTYISKKGRNHKVVFLIDDLGKCVEDNFNAIFELQSIVETLCDITGNSFFIIATGQNSLETIVNERENQFYNLLSAFETKIYLTSDNIEEIIKERLLKKNSDAELYLKRYYGKNKGIINKLLLFTEDKEIYNYMYIKEDDFIAYYPFFPYQLNIIIGVMVSMKGKGLLNKFFLGTEYSIITAFQEVIVYQMDKDDMAIATLSMFYSSLNKFFAEDQSFTIVQAFNNSNLNEFDLEVLKTLFMAKQIENIDTNIENLVSMLISNLSQDRNTVKKQVEESLEVLLKENLIEEIDGSYIYLSTEELEIQEDLIEISVTEDDINNYISKDIFANILPEPVYEYSPRYSYKYNQSFDNKFFTDNDNSLNLKFISPFSIKTDALGFQELLSQKNNIIVEIPEDEEYIKNIEKIIKIQKFINSQYNNRDEIVSELKYRKEKELINLKLMANSTLTNLLNNSNIYIEGKKQTMESNTFIEKINEALSILVPSVYNKMVLMETEPTIEDINRILEEDYSDIKYELLPNQYALDEILNYLETNSQNNVKTTVKSLTDDFKKAPYGFVDEDIQWLIAILFKYEKIRFIIDNKPLTVNNTDLKEIHRYIFSIEDENTIQIELFQEVNNNQKQAAKQVMEILFEKVSSNDETDTIMSDYMEGSIILINKLYSILQEYHQIEPRYPGKETIKEGIDLLEIIQNSADSLDFFRQVEAKQNELINLHQKLVPIMDFYKGNDSEIFLKACKIIDELNTYKNFILDKDLLKEIDNLESTINDMDSLDRINELELLIENFKFKYNLFISKEVAKLKKEIDTDKQTVLTILEQKKLTNNLAKKYLDMFDILLENIDEISIITDIELIRLESDLLVFKCLNEINKQQVFKSGISMNVKHINIREVSKGLTKVIEKDKDIDIFITSLKEKIKDEKDDNTIIYLV